MNKLLLIVDPQVDFITGSLPVGGAAEAMDALADYVKEHGDEYVVKIVTSDWHPYHHSSFADEGGQWPRHCVQHSAGASIWESLLVALNESRGGFTLLYKGDSVEKEEYSIMQNERSAANLYKLIKLLKIDQIDVCGLAGDICVLNTAKDLKEIIGNANLNILEDYSPSLDGGKALRSFVESII
ncbi:isochorismatase family protein [Prevotella sp.]